MSLRIGRFFGINLYLHWSFWLLPLWVVYTHTRDPEGLTLGLRLGLLGALFACVVLHEYGHALMARLFRISTRDITLYPIGGIARLERMSEKPWEEFCIAIAGPLVNIAIAAVLGAGMLLTWLAAPGALDGVAGTFLLLLLVMNLVVLFGFNLIPAFPMDGGRVLRALLAIPLGRLRATRIAVLVSAVIVVLGGVAAALVLQNPWLVLIGIFLLWAGQQELRAVEARAHDLEDEILPETAAPPWHQTAGSAVTVYIWDPRKHAWIAQGVIPASEPEA